MASKKNSLGKYIRSRKEKYKRGYRYLIHISNSPHKVLNPNITSIAYSNFICDEKNRIISCDYERFQPLVYLSPPQHYHKWVYWSVDRKRKPNNNGNITMYAHIVTVPFKDLQVLTDRFNDELVCPNSIPVVKIIPFRCKIEHFYQYEYQINRDKVLRKLDYYKKIYRYHQNKRYKIVNWFMCY